jgi:hypothetical protein
MKKIWHAQIERKLCQEKSVLPFPQTWSLNSLITCAYDAHIPREREFPSYLISINSFYRYRYRYTDTDIQIQIYRYRYTDTDIHIQILHSTLPIRVFQWLVTYCFFRNTLSILTQVTLNMPSNSIKTQIGRGPTDYLTQIDWVICSLSKHHFSPKCPEA